MEQQMNEKDQRRLSAQRKNSITKAVWIIVAIVVVGGIVWLIASQPKTSESEIISRSGLHWHPGLTIYVKGEKLEIPENIGIGAVHQPIHTHDDSGQGVVHMEFQGLARKQDVTLGQFFKNWGKDMRSFGTNMKMAVNGEENTEYENYIMRDKDKIELWFD